MRPLEIPVHRQEVYEAIQRENMKASQLDPQEVRPLGRVGASPLLVDPKRPPRQPAGHRLGLGHTHRTRYIIGERGIARKCTPPLSVPRAERHALRGRNCCNVVRPSSAICLAIPSPPP